MMPHAIEDASINYSVAVVILSMTCVTIILFISYLGPYICVYSSYCEINKITAILFPVKQD